MFIKVSFNLQFSNFVYCLESVLELPYILPFAKEFDEKNIEANKTRKKLSRLLNLKFNKINTKLFFIGTR